MALSGRPSLFATIYQQASRSPSVGEQTLKMVYNTYVLKTCKHMSYQQRINCYTTAYAVVKILLYGDLRINKYSYSYVMCSQKRELESPL